MNTRFKFYLIAAITLFTSVLLGAKTVDTASNNIYGKFEYRKTIFFPRNVLFYNCAFSEGIKLSMVRYQGQIAYVKCHFVAKTRFGNCLYEKGISFHDCKFQKYFAFEATTVDSLANFFGNSFDTTSFSEAHFRKGVKFWNDTFSGQTDFSNAVFENFVDFNKTVFRQTVDFSKTIFNKTAAFDYCMFSTATYFNNLRFSPTTDLSFKHCVLPPFIDFSNNPQIPNEIDLTTASFTKDFVRSDLGRLSGYFMPWRSDRGETIHYINLYNSELSKFNLDYSHFKLELFDRRYVQKNKKFYPDGTLSYTIETEFYPMSKDKITGVYEGLLRNFKERGQNDNYKKLDIELRYVKAGGNFIRQFFLGYLPDWWSRFGYERERIFLHILFFLALFTISTYFIGDYLQRNVYEIEFVQRLLPKSIDVSFAGNFTFKNRLIFSVSYTLSVFFIFPSVLQLSHLSFNFSFKSILGAGYILLLYLVGIVCITHVGIYLFQ